MQWTHFGLVDNNKKNRNWGRFKLIKLVLTFYGNTYGPEKYSGPRLVVLTASPIERFNTV
jgi:hypothetical protein